MNNEIWKDIVGYEGLYQVSNMGQVRNSKGLIKKQRLNPNGYMITDLSKCGKFKTHYIHRLVALAFIDGYFEGAEVDHIDSNRVNNRADNLRWVNHSGNMLNPITKERNSNAHKGRKLSEETKQKFSDARKGDKHWNYGNKWDEETINKNRLSQPNRKRVRCIETDIIYDSINQASKSTGINYTSLNDCVSGKQKTAGGYHWEVINDA